MSVTSAADTGLILPLVVFSVSGLKEVGNGIFNLTDSLHGEIYLGLI